MDDQMKVRHYLESNGLKATALALPRLVLDWDGDGSRFVVTSIEDPMMIPSDTWIWMYIFDAHGKALGTAHFCAGIHSIVDSLAFETIPKVGKALLICASPVMNGRYDVAGFYVALDGSRPATVRVEDKKGKPIFNDYSFPNTLMGPEPDPSKMVTELESKSPVELLEALTWCNAEPFEGPDCPVIPVYSQDNAKARLKAMYADPVIIRRLHELQESDVPWVSETAKDALTKAPWTQR